MGEHCAYALAREGCNLALTARSEPELESVAKRCRERGAKQVVVLPADFRDMSAVGKLVDSCVTALGGLNILVSNAGVYHYGPTAKAHYTDWEEMFDVNVRAAMRLTREAVAPIVKGAEGKPGRGAVIYITSRAAMNTFRGGSGYCASKQALAGFAGALFEDIAESGVKVSVIKPGWTNTEMVAWMHVDKSMMIQPSEVAELVRIIATWPDGSCPREILLTPQRVPKKLPH